MVVPFIEPRRTDYECATGTKNTFRSERDEFSKSKYIYLGRENVLQQGVGYLGLALLEEV